MARTTPLAALTRQQRLDKILDEFAEIYRVSRDDEEYLLGLLLGEVLQTAEEMGLDAPLFCSQTLTAIRRKKGWASKP